MRIHAGVPGCHKTHELQHGDTKKYESWNLHCALFVCATLVSSPSDKETELTKQQMMQEGNQNQRFDGWLPIHLPLPQIRLYLRQIAQTREIPLFIQFQSDQFKLIGAIWRDHCTRTQDIPRESALWSLSWLVTGCSYASSAAFSSTEFTQAGAHRTNAPASKI